ncbi:MAG: hypothetical protein IPL40_13845 [Proteobacteria bacterium]|nr:hypothetical protein [Pseudomonadota bacterium]
MSAANAAAAPEGAPASTDAPAEGAAESIDLDERFLCTDGACIGVIGAAGYCRECGKPIAAGELGRFEQVTGARLGPSFRAQEASPSAALAGGSGQLPAVDPAGDWAGARLQGDGGSATIADSSAPDLETRELCPDGACIGVIGSDGRCKECGAALATWESR